MSTLYVNIYDNQTRYNNAAAAYWHAFQQKYRVPEIEAYLLQSENLGWCFAYARDFLQKRWVEYEKLLLNSKNLQYCFLYARDIIKGQWSEAEEIISIDLTWTQNYCCFFNISTNDFYDKIIQKNSFIITKLPYIPAGLKEKYRQLLITNNIGII